MPIKNYTTKIPASQTVGEIQQMLAKHGAKSIMLNYTDRGEVESVSFSIATPLGIRAFRLPTKTAGVASALAKAGTKCTATHAENVAWRITKDWLDAQLAFLEAEQAEIDQLFLPYMVNDQGQTVYELFCSKQLQLCDGAVENN